jgi:prepilin-type N-terminal cleavage/methylation domain-containing protein
MSHGFKFFNPRGWHRYCYAYLKFVVRTKAGDTCFNWGSMRKESGFSLVELLMVVAIIGIIASIAIPGLRRARQYAQSASAIQSLRTISTAEALYERKFKRYGTLAELRTEDTIDTLLATGNKSGYIFALTLGADDKSFRCTGTPQEEPAVASHLFINETAVIRYNVGAAADENSDPIPR